LTKPWLIFCEGSAHKAFFSQFIKKRALLEFQIQFPYSEEQLTGGISQYERFLSHIKMNEGFHQLQAILIIADNDNNSAARFQEDRNQISRAGG
jgi:hypothetical protein